MASEDMDGMISGYRALTGKFPVMPKRVVGLWQSHEKYDTQDKVLGTLKGFCDRKIPLDNIVLDWNHWPENAWDSHKFDKPRFPDPKAMVDLIHAMHGRMMISVWPKFYVTTEYFKEFDENDWTHQQSVRNSLKDRVGSGYHYGFYDVYDSDTRKLFWKQMHKHYYPSGIDTWWIDASEPSVRDCIDLEYRRALYGPVALGSSIKLLNAYVPMNAEATYNGQHGVDNNKRVLLLARSGFTGLQHYSTAAWNGDIDTRREDMKAQIPIGLNFIMNGISYWTMDIGGFHIENRYAAGQKQWDTTKTENADCKEWRGLNTRWYQFGALVPLYHAYGQYPFREIWEIAPEGHPAYQSVVYYTKLRYSMMPYIYPLTDMTQFNDYATMRPLVMDFAADTQVNNIDNQYTFDPSFMVSPVYRHGDRGCKIYFPQVKGWYDFYSGKFQPGGERKVIEAPYERTPLYMRVDAVVPFGDDIQYTDEEPTGHIRLYIYQGVDEKFMLYESEGVNYSYEQGMYTMTPMKYDEATKTLVIGEHQGEFSDILKECTSAVATVNREKAQLFNPNTKGVTVKYNGSEQTLRLQVK